MRKRIIWNEEEIRKELRRMDQLTGLSGATLPIRFNEAWATLGSYRLIGRKAGGFCFSNRYLQDPDFTPEEALDTIRHEYAHYMDYELYGNTGHGRTWKACCCRWARSRSASTTVRRGAPCAACTRGRTR